MGLAFVLTGLTVILFMAIAINTGLDTLKKWRPNLTDLASNGVGLSVFSLIMFELGGFLNGLSTPLRFLNSLSYALSFPMFGTALGSSLCSWHSGYLLLWKLVRDRKYGGPYRKRGRVWQMSIAVLYLFAGFVILKRLIEIVS